MSVVIYEWDASEPVVNGLVCLVVAQVARRDFSFGDVRFGIGHFQDGPLERRRQRGRETDQIDSDDDFSCTGFRA